MIQPKIFPIQRLVTPHIDHIRLDNGIEVSIIPDDSVGIIKMDVIVECGRPNEDKRLASKAAGDLLVFGTSNRSRQEIADFFDYKGATISTSGEADATTLTLFCQTQFFLELVKSAFEILVIPAFAQNELSAYQDRMTARLEEDLHNPDVVAYRIITEDIYSTNHPYGYNSTADMYRALCSSDLHEIHKRAFHPKNTHIILSGTIPPNAAIALNKTFGSWQSLGEFRQPTVRTSPVHPLTRRMKISTNGSTQTSLRIGKRMFNRTHDDYYALYFLNLILGGYFGSRLMKILRERDAITYDIHSYLESMRHDGLFLISGEIKQGKESIVIDEIRNAMETLCNNVIAKQEMEKARNYLFGQLMIMTQGPFNTSEYLKHMIAEGRNISELDRLSELLNKIGPGDLLSLAKRIFDWRTFHVVSVY
jgi:predicted Zn-dependent peptidase